MAFVIGVVAQQEVDGMARATSVFLQNSGGGRRR